MPEIVEKYLSSKFQILEGTAVNPGNMTDRKSFARDLGRFLAGLERLETNSAPTPGFENAFAGSRLDFFEVEIDDKLQRYKTLVPRDFLLNELHQAMMKPWKKQPVWLHGDFTPKNVLQSKGRFSGVLNINKAVVGDPACDLAVAWFLFNSADRKIFFGAADADPATVARARLHALRQALKTYQSSDIDEEIQARDALAEILQDLNYKGEEELFDQHFTEGDGDGLPGAL